MGVAIKNSFSRKYIRDMFLSSVGKPREVATEMQLSELIL